LFRWSEWNTNCSAVYTTFPEPLPVGTRVPQWAYLPIGANDLWNVASAEADISGPESTATAQGPTTLSGYATTATTATSSSSATTTVNPGGSTGGGGAGGGTSNSTNVGAIAGGVVGGVIGLAIVVLLGILLLRRRNSNHVAPSSLVNTSQYSSPTPLVAANPNMGYNNNTGSTVTTSFPVSPMTSGPSMRLYDPSDPTTYPVPVGAGVVNGLDPTLRPLSNATHGGAGAGYPYGYQGGPEVQSW